LNLFVWVILFPRPRGGWVASHGEVWTGRSPAWEKFGEPQTRIEQWRAIKTLLAKSEL